jgi:chemotaxis protein MotB
MKKTFFLSLITLFIMSSCVSKKEFTSLENRHKKTQDLLNTATVKLNACLEEKTTSETLANAYKDQLSDLKRRNDQLFVQSQDYLELTAKGAENLEKTLESIKEKDLKITRIQDALNRKDSVTFALVTSLKKEIGINDPDIEVNVDKAVVFISLSDKLLFKSGSYEVSQRAKEVLGKVATVVN